MLKKINNNIRDRSLATHSERQPLRAQSLFAIFTPSLGDKTVYMSTG